MKNTSSQASQVKGCRGFTLIELLITISVLLVLVAAAAPSMTNMIRRNRLAATADRIVEGLAVARNEAIKSGTTVSLKQLTPGTGGWNTGWSVVSGETTLYSGGPLGVTTVVPGSYVQSSAGNAFTSEAALTEIAYSRVGTREIPSGLTYKALVACDVGNSEANPYKAVLLFPNGMVQVKTKAELNFTPDPCL